jgi:hypothetical protein
MSARTTARATTIALCCVAAAAWAQSGRAAASPAAGKAPAAHAPRKPLALRQVKVTETARKRYIAAWGVDELEVTSTSSGNLIRFRYRVIDPEKAKVLGDRRSAPYMLGQRSRALLQVPTMDKVGQLRQAGTPNAGQEYWIVFSNKGQLVKVGDRVDVMIGAFRAEGLVVEGP